MTSKNFFSNPDYDSNAIVTSQLEELIDLQSSILGATVTNYNCDELLQRLCLLAEKLTPNSVASIMMLDCTQQQLFIHTAPSMPAAAKQALNGLKAGDGSCGNAVFHNEDMFVCNTLTDKRWENVRDFAKNFKIHACWSSPIRNAAKQPIGSFALSSFAKRTPDNFQRRLLNICASIAGIIFQREASAIEKQLANRNLQESRESLAVTIESIADGVISTDISGRIVVFNRVAELLTGCNHDWAIGKKLDTVFNIIDSNEQEINCIPINCIEDKSKCYRHDSGIKLVSADGTKRYVSISESQLRNDKGEYTGVVVAFRDITDTKKAEDELLKARKLDSIGLLAGGIAHDFNNLLGIIQGYVDLASHSTDLPEKTQKYLQKAGKASEQAACLTQQLLTFSKGGEPIRKAANIAEIIYQSTDFSLHGSNIHVSYHCDDDLWVADIDSGQISQVLQNMVINARQAMPNGGCLDISCENAELENPADGQGSVQRFIKVVVKDSGSGIAQEIIGSIFDPYFTTKQEGNGLGLALSYSIIKKHGGNILVESTLGEGSSFTLFLPVADQPVDVSLEQDQMTERSMSNTRILIMDDDETLREVTSEMLEELGYAVAQAADGGAALSQYKTAMGTDNTIDLVIMDLTIPSGIGGKDAIKLLQEIDPEAKALVSSGYCNDPVMANYRDYGFLGAIKKPYNLSDLNDAITAVLKQ